MRKWFKAKNYGWGWYPASWQGWVVTFAFIWFELWNFGRLDAMSNSITDTLWPFILQTIPVVLILIIICHYTGEPPRWRWGRK